MFDYHAANDETIIARSHDGDDAATDFLLEKYKPLVKKKARTLFLIGGDNDDLIQEGMIALYKAIRAFRADRESSFVHYASLCIDNQLYNVIKGANRLKNRRSTPTFPFTRRSTPTRKTIPARHLPIHSSLPNL